MKKFEVHFKNEFENGVGSEIPLCRFRDFETGGVHRRMFYEELKCKITESVLELWQNKYFLHPNDPEIWSLARECCSETKLLELQWKILHNIYPTGVLLKKMKIRNDDLCQFCEEVDTLSHFLYPVKYLM